MDDGSQPTVRRFLMIWHHTCATDLRGVALSACSFTSGTRSRTFASALPLSSPDGALWMNPPSWYGARFVAPIDFVSPAGHESRSYG